MTENDDRSVVNNDKTDKTVRPPDAKKVYGAGEILVREQVISIEQLNEAMNAVHHGESLTKALTDLGVSKRTVLEHWASVFKCPIVDIKDQIPREILGTVSPELLLKYGIVPMEKRGGTLVVAFGNPLDLRDAMEDIKFSYGLSVEPVLADETAISEALDHYFKDEDTVADALKQLPDETRRLLEQLRVAEDKEETTPVEVDNDIVTFVNAMLADAIIRTASDVHFEPQEKQLVVRFRIDGVLHDVHSTRPESKLPIAARIKVMSHLDISEKRLPQDGQMRLRLGNREIDCRVATLPSVHGEKIVIRILNQAATRIELATLGFFDDQLKTVQEAVHQPNGMVLVTGPTGSGKTTTLYSALALVNQRSRNILTVEDPVEMQLHGATQVQVDDAANRTFATIMRAFLRQDPNVIMVGEIRDFETAEIGVKLAMTGHLVLSTLHTNDAALTINRLTTMGIEPFNVAEIMRLIIAQRLARIICQKCKRKVKLSEIYTMQLGLKPDTEAHEGAGCSACGNTGYKGRTGIYEILPISQAIRNAIISSHSADEIKALAVKEGMWTLRKSALRKMAAGIISAEEVLRVTRAD